jgi:hypothetical protein
MTYQFTDFPIDRGGPPGTPSDPDVTDEDGSSGGGTTNPGSQDYTWFGSYTHYVSSPGGEVYALYNGLLEREPDPSSDYWLKLLNQGTSLEGVT